MNDHIKSEIPSYLAGELPESRNRQIEAHAASCEKCRNALSKARSKQARVKREALKKASPDRSPNLFLARQGKWSGTEVAPSRKPWVFAMLLVLAGGGYWAYQKRSIPVESVLPNSADSAPEPVVSTPSVPIPPAAPPPEKAVEAPKPPIVLRVIQDWKGPDSAVMESRLVVIRNETTWQKLWAEMQSKDPMPVIDFSDKVVVGVFAGERPAGTTILLGRIEEDPDDHVMMAPYRITLPTVQVSTTSVAAVPPTPAISHPYLLAMIPRVDKKIRLIEKEKSQ